MLTGVLVIAFPVSVFSDLWSRELKQFEGFDHLLEDNAGADTESTGGLKFDTTNKQIAFGTQQPASWQGQQEENQANRGINPERSIAMKRQDIRELLECLHTIRESERRMRAILRTYHFDEL